MLNKKNIIISFSIIIIAIICICIVSDTRINRIEQDAFLAKHFDSIDELESVCDLVIIGKATGGRENITFGEGFAQNGYTLTQIKILDILKEDPERTIKKNDIITIAEPYYIMEGPLFKGKNLIIPHGCTEIVDDCKYILALSWNDNIENYAGYCPVQSKFNIDSKDNRELQNMKKNKRLESLKEQTLNKYRANINKILIENE